MTRIDLIAEIAEESTGYEIGVLEGDFSAEILNLPVKRLVLIDPWLHYKGDYEKDPANVDQAGQDQRCYRVMARFIDDPRVRVIRHESISPLNEYVVKQNPPDWVYIDANHSYESALSDLRFWSRFTKVLFVHDFVENETSQAMGFGVARAVNEFVVANPQWNFKAVTDEEWPTVKLQKF